MKYREGIDRRENELRRREAIRFSGGIGVIAASIAIAAGGLSFAVVFLDRDHPAPSVSTLVQLLFLFSIPIALLSRKESRSDLASHVLDQSMRTHSGDNPAARLIVSLLMLGLLHGEFMVIDAMKAWWLRAKLRRADRDHAAVILATLSSRPEGMSPGNFLRHGESLGQLRLTLAYLVSSEWVDISRDGRDMTLLSPAKRALRN